MTWEKDFKWAVEKDHALHFLWKKFGTPEYITDIGLQKKGYDIIIHRGERANIIIDTKHLRKFSNIFFMEWISNNNKKHKNYNKPGWIKEEKECDIIAYVEWNNNIQYKCYMLYYKLLRNWVLENKDNYKLIETKEVNRTSNYIISKLDILNAKPRILWKYIEGKI